MGAGRSRLVIAIEAGGRRFESCLAGGVRPVAQLVERLNTGQQPHIRTHAEACDTEALNTEIHIHITVVQGGPNRMEHADA